MNSKMKLTDDNIMNTVQIVYRNHFVFKKHILDWFIHHNYDFSTESYPLTLSSAFNTYFLVADEDVLVHFKLEWL